MLTKSAPIQRSNPLTGVCEWNVLPVASLVASLVMISGTGAVIIFCIYRTNIIINQRKERPKRIQTKKCDFNNCTYCAHFRSADTYLSTPTRMMHRQLFNALLIQTAVPVVLSYSPLGTFLLWPFTGIALGAFGNVLFLTTAIFPSIDAFFVLFFIRKFRVAVIELLRLPFKTGSVGIEQPSSTLGTLA